MTLQLAPLTSAILSLAWQTEPGVTYTIRTSTDMQNWHTLPYVVVGDGAAESYYLDNPDSMLFVSLQYDSDGDTDNNALPDLWEWQHFGHIGADPGADPDLDGDSTYIEWLSQTDPTDFYNSEWPVIEIACGRQWLVPTDTVSSQNIVLRVRQPSGEPWRNAPVNLSMESGSPVLVVIGSDSMHCATSLVAWTDDLGRIDPLLDAIHVKSPVVQGTTDRVSIRAGRSDAGILIHSVGEDFGKPPRNLSKYINREGQSIYSWSGDPGEADSFLLQELDTAGNWHHIIEIATSNLSPPDPVYGSYMLIVEN